MPISRLPEAPRAKVTLLHRAPGYRDRRLDGLDAALLVEVVEHLEGSRSHDGAPRTDPATAS